MPSSPNQPSPSSLGEWASALLYQTDSVARDRLETPPLAERIQSLLEQMLASTGRCFQTWGGTVLTILPIPGRLVRHGKCGGKGCTADGCRGFGWIRTKKEKPHASD